MPLICEQVEMITTQSMKAGFTGGLVVDYPNSTKAKKFFLVLMTGGAQPLPQARTTAFIFLVFLYFGPECMLSAFAF
jgi:hypothetical protein